MGYGPQPHPPAHRASNPSVRTEIPIHVTFPCRWSQRRPWSQRRVVSILLRWPPSNFDPPSLQQRHLANGTLLRPHHTPTILPLVNLTTLTSFVRGRGERRRLPLSCPASALHHRRHAGLPQNHTLLPLTLHTPRHSPRASTNHDAYQSSRITPTKFLPRFNASLETMHHAVHVLLNVPQTIPLACTLFALRRSITALHICVVKSWSFLAPVFDRDSSHLLDAFALGGLEGWVRLPSVCLSIDTAGVPYPTDSLLLFLHQGLCPFSANRISYTTGRTGLRRDLSNPHPRRSVF